MEQQGTFSITVDAGYQLHFGQTIDDLLASLRSSLDYKEIENDLVYFDNDTGIASIRTHLTANESIDVDKSACFEQPSHFDRNESEWYPGDYNDEPKLTYDANGIISDVKDTIRQFHPIGSVCIKLGSVQTSDYETSLTDKYIGEL